MAVRGHCLAYYAYKDIEKLEKFMSGKPVAEQEIGHALLQEVVAFAETSISRRKFILHYFGEEFDTETGEGGDMDDNVRHPKKKVEAKDEVKILLETISKTNEKYKSKDLVNVIIGKENALINSHKTNEQDFFGKGKARDNKYWMALLRQVLVSGFLKKDIETYGVIKLKDAGRDFIANPESFMMTEDHIFDGAQEDGSVVTAAKGANAVADATLMRMLKDLRKKNAKKLGVPPFVVFQDPSLEDMALKYPVTIVELGNVHGVGDGKAKKYGKDFVALIAQYVEDNDITRPDDLVVKSTGSNSANKLYIIQNVDRKLPLDDIASSKGMSMSDFIKEMEAIVYSGTKLNITYWVDDILDEDQQEEIHDYFMESSTDSISDAIEEFDGDYDDEELRLYRIKFISEVAN
ncbi:ATP-dependent DNA helicase RecQ [Algibacter lectus]|uniref:DNA 3'-5' helicase n=1 Tax=Algibacter lectus TaxID=221126 RepID=A0A090X5C9_9FLAO|nr:ATP-dependent DNA helicase RecQ [Algibacter lectus]